MVGGAAFCFLAPNTSQAGSKGCMRMTTKTACLLLGIAVVTASLLMTPFCGFMFRCGCSWIWTTAAAHCNIHHSMPPHCPWCSYGDIGYFLPYAGFIIGQALAGILVLRFTGKLALSVIVTILALVPVGLLMGVLTLALVDYPLFILH
jgi:hypothetical protein